VQECIQCIQVYVMQGSVVGFVGVAKGRVVAVSTAAWDLLREIYRVDMYTHTQTNTAS